MAAHWLALHGDRPPKSRPSSCPTFHARGLETSTFDIFQGKSPGRAFDWTFARLFAMLCLVVLLACVAHALYTGGIGAISDIGAVFGTGAVSDPPQGAGVVADTLTCSEWKVKRFESEGGSLDSRRTSTMTETLLGHFSSADECEAACLSYSGEHSRCHTYHYDAHAWAWRLHYDATRGDWRLRRACVSITTTPEASKPPLLTSSRGNPLDT
eukprot:CAMPEP_0180276710 /NCGR_PEP_ID=MMETSP0988-20121125/6532_1 /TAXON_ID=697907 /ORGANISM="non described non described, Strain CCMP2293" /LENGTH=211 /DNA_ID=CAMNT_0022248083 /DNA_START=106 /DNA_END=741 /DNA_ORIENTATION=+